jgi:Tol biopolymer transport system component
MGEVYRARDTKLARDVALKILPDAFTHDPERLARFRREAQVLAALNHPNIGAIYGLDEANGTHFLVLELVDGETLAQRIAAGPLPVEKALTIAMQIAEALDAAHEKGIVHRDLKPANIALTADDRVKVLDFGLAKVTEAAVGSSFDLTQSPTAFSPAKMTGVGAIVGTAAYMSPEQARGQLQDKRADIWSFGCVLFEMVTGHRAITGDTDSVADTIAAVLKVEPDWATLPTRMPPGATRLLRRCLEKDVRRRLRDIGDARVDIEEALSAGVGTSTRATTVGIKVARVVRFERLSDFVGMNESPVLSPDRKMVAFVALSEGRRQIFVRLLAGGWPLQLTRDDADHERPRWLPDSSALIYYTPSPTPGEQGTIWEISALGGSSRPIASALGAGDISHDGRRIACFRFDYGRFDLVAVTRDGARTDYVRPLPPLVFCDCPRWSPDDQSIAFQGHVVAYFDQRIFIIGANGGPVRNIVSPGILRGIAWLPDQSGLLYSSSTGSLLPYPPTFNLRTVGCDGTGDRQVTFGDMSYVDPDVNPSGSLVACRIRSRSDIWRFPITGDPAENTRNGVQITRQAGHVQTPSASPDGRELVYLSDSGGHGNLWVAGADGHTTRQITFERDPDSTVGVPVWSPAGNRIAFLLTRAGENYLWLVNRDGSGLQKLPVQGFYACWSPDGEWLYYSPPYDRPWRIEKLRVKDGTAVCVRQDNAIAPAAAVDGTALYYATQVEHDAGALGDWEIRMARPEDGAPQTLARIVGSRVPISSTLIHMFLSPDGSNLALPLTNGTTCNVWLQPTNGGTMQRVTDFGNRPVMIARRVSWSADGDGVYAAVAEIESDVILFDGILN